MSTTTMVPTNEAGSDGGIPNKNVWAFGRGIETAW